MKITKVIAFIIICITFGYTIIDSVIHIQAEIHHRNGYIKQERGYPKLAHQDFKKAVKKIPWENHYRLQLAKSYPVSCGFPGESGPRRPGSEPRVDAEALVEPQH